MNTPIKVMLVEDNPEYRAVVALALEDESDITLLSQFGTAEIALRSLGSATNYQKPDLILLDLNLPGMSGIEALPYFSQALPGTRVMILTQSDREEDVLQAISNGADGYLLKSTELGGITGGIRSVMAGGASLDANIARLVLDNLQHRLPKSEEETTLTKRELQILKLLAEGFVKKEIADQLNIGYSTVDTHVSNIYEKLEVRNAPSAVSQAFRKGLLNDQQD